MCPRKNSAQNEVKHICKEILDYEVEAIINGHAVALEVDTGSVITLINEVTWRNLLDASTLRPASLELRSYSHGKVSLLGKLDASVEINVQRAEFCARVAKGKARNLLGRDLLCQVRLGWQSIFAVYIPKEKKLKAVLDGFEEVFVEETELCKCVMARINMKSNALPTFRKTRPLPYAMKKKVENQLDHLEQKGFITPVQCSDWAAPAVPFVKLDGSVRLCGDFSVSMNPKMEVNQYHLPQPNETFTNLNGGVLLSKVDSSEAYLQIELDE